MTAREVRAAEERRCQAIAEGDAAALAAVLSDDLHYLHSTGVLEGKEAYIATSVAGTPRTVERGDLNIRVLGDVAIVTGDYAIRIEPPEEAYIQATGLQVWVREPSGWLLLAHQGTPRTH